MQRRWRAFPQPLVALAGATAAEAHTAAEDLRLAADKNRRSPRCSPTSRPAVGASATMAPAPGPRTADRVRPTSG